MKYISFVVPCYNSEKYMAKCIESLLLAGEDVEILVVNDGSKDNTSKIAHEFEAKYPTIIKVFDKENGGHGSALNVGLKNASGLYFKCVDSDDWVDEKSYLTIIDTIKKHAKENNLPDLYINDFVYERIDKGTQFVASHVDKLPQDKFFSWDECHNFGLTEYFMMHSLIFKLSVLKDCDLVLPEKTYYIDNFFVYAPLKYVTKMYYINVPFYRYYVGRSDQSVTFENMKKNHMMQLRVMEAMTYKYTYKELKCLKRKHRKFIIHDFVIISYLTLFYFSLDGLKETHEIYKNYLREFKKKNRAYYYKVKYRTYFIVPFLLIPPLRYKAIMHGYRKICEKTNWN